MFIKNSHKFITFFCDTRKCSPFWARIIAIWEGRYIKSRKQDGKAVYGYIYAHSYLETCDSRCRCFCCSTSDSFCQNILCCISDSCRRLVLLCAFPDPGLRIGELCALKWEDFSFSEKTIFVHQTMQRLSGLFTIM